jgi:hypothetical protein
MAASGATLSIAVTQRHPRMKFRNVAVSSRCATHGRMTPFAAQEACQSRIMKSLAASSCDSASVLSRVLHCNGATAIAIPYSLAHLS